MNAVEPTGFTEQIENALKQYADPVWLGTHSPLATASFLSSFVEDVEQTATKRGQALQRLLAVATADIDGKYAERYQTILHEYYFRNRPAAVVWDQVGLAKNSFHLSRKGAIAALEAALIARMQPALRLEQPPLPPTLLERDDLVAHCQQHLDAPKTVALVGAAGIGKTACAAQIARSDRRPIFWYTIRPTLNDAPTSLVFALALFAHRHGHSTLWLALTTNQALSQSANPGQPINEQTLSALRYVLSALDPLPLLCIDGVELLQPSGLAQHEGFVLCLDALRGLVPILLLGQQIPVEHDQIFSLSALSAAAVSQLLLAELGSVTPPMRAEFYQLTQGNPRFVKLCLAALANGEAIDSLQTVLQQSAALDQLFRHTLLRLPEATRKLLMALSVFRSPTALEEWAALVPDQTTADLQAQGLLQLGRNGAVELPLIYREFLLQQMAATTIQRLHEQAAALRSKSGAYSAAAYHWVEADQPEMALALWREFQEQEIAQGQAATALSLFRRVQRLRLLPAAYEQTTLICATLERLLGATDQAVTTLQSVLMKTPLFVVEGADLAGMLANDRSEFGRADDAFARGLTVGERLVEVRMARLHKGRAWMHLRQRELDQAENELALAQFEIANMQGNLAMDRSCYTEATAHYQRALHLAEQLALPDAIGKCTTNLGSIALFQGAYEQAKGYLTQAGAAYARIGKVAAEAGSRITLAVAHNQAGEHERALTLLQEAEGLLTVQDTLQPWQQALLAQARAEAYLGAGDWAATEEWVQIAIAAEEISILPDSYRVYGELCTQRGAYGEAEQFLEQSLSLAEANADQYLAAYAWRSLGKLYRAMEQETQATTAHEEAITRFAAMDLAHEIEQCR